MEGQVAGVRGAVCCNRKIQNWPKVSILGQMAPAAARVCMGPSRTLPCAPIGF